MSHIILEQLVISLTKWHMFRMNGWRGQKEGAGGGEQWQSSNLLPATISVSPLSPEHVYMISGDSLGAGGDSPEKQKPS